MAASRSWWRVAACAGLVGCGGAGGPPTAEVWGEHSEATARVGSAEPGVGVAPPGPCEPTITRRVHPASRAGSTIALVTEGDARRLYVADEDGDALHVFDAEGPRALAVVPLAGRPTQVLALPDGRLVVTLRDANQLAVLAPDTSGALAVRCTLPTPTEPFGLAVSPDGATIALTAGWAGALELRDGATLATRRSVALAAEPRGVIVSADGETAWITHAIGGVVSSVALADGAARTTHTRPAGAERRRGRALRGAEAEQPGAASQGFALAEVALDAGPGRILAPLAASDPEGPREAFPSTYGGGGGPSAIRAFVAVLDPTKREVLGAQLARDRAGLAEDCVLPRAVATHEHRLFVACLGTDAVVELDARAADPISAERRRVQVGPGPSGVVVDAAGGQVFVASSWSRELVAFGLDPAPTSDAQHVPARALAWTGPAPTHEALRLARGRQLFHATRDVRTSQDGRACAGCHVDGRADGLTWATPDGPRQTISLAGRVDATGRFGWSGGGATLAAHVETTVTRLGGHGFATARDRGDRDALLAYVASMPAPRPAQGDAALIARGRAVFESPDAACGTCHPAGGTDGLRHDVGSGDPREASLAFDTPSLRLSAGSAPYFHDGRYADLFALVSDPASKMGGAAALLEADRRALVAYVASLEVSAPARTIPPHDAWPAAASEPAPVSPRAPRAFGSLQGNHEWTFSTRAGFAGRTFDLDALPVVTLPAATAPSVPASLDALTPAAGGEELVVLRGGPTPRISLRGVDLGLVHVHPGEPAAVGRLAEGGATLACGGAGTLRRLTYRGAQRVPDGEGMRFVWGTGWLDPSACRVVITERHEARPAHVAAGVVYGFRARCVGCGPDDDQLHLVTPQAGGSWLRVAPLAHHVMPLGPGTASALQETYTFLSPGGGPALWAWDAERMPDWDDVFGRRCTDRTWCAKRVRFEVSRAAGERAAMAVLSGDADQIR